MKILLTLEIDVAEARATEDDAWQIINKVLIEARDEGETGRPQFSVRPHTIFFPDHID